MTFPAMSQVAAEALRNLRRSPFTLRRSVLCPYFVPDEPIGEDVRIQPATRNMLERAGFADSASGRLTITEDGETYLDALDAGDAPAPTETAQGACRINRRAAATNQNNIQKAI